MSQQVLYQNHHKNNNNNNNNNNQLNQVDLIKTKKKTLI